MEQTATLEVTQTRIKAPGTCGELVQGAIGDRDFLVNCPIDLYSYAYANRSDEPGLRLANAAHFGKVRDAIALAEYEWGLRPVHDLVIDSHVPRGKGMASSTADLTAALGAIARNCGRSVSPQMFANLLTEIEPSDCVHFRGIAHVNHLTGELFESLPTPLNLQVLIVDCGGEIDTIGFDRERARGIYREHQLQITGALNLLTRGLREHNAAWIAEAATQSASLSQRIHYKPQFDQLLGMARELGALGVNCAHSGSVLGVIYRPNDRLQEMLTARIEDAFGATVPIIGNHHIIGGGYVEYQA